MTVTVAGERRSWSMTQLRTWPQIARLRIDRSAADGIAVDDPVTVDVAGVPSLTAVVTGVHRHWRHWQVDAAPAVLLHLARDTIDAIPEGTTRQASELARRIIGADARFDGGTDVQLPRWSTRPRTAGWALASLLATIGDRIGRTVTWRYSARADLVIVEPDRAAWEEVEPPAVQRREGEFTVYDEAPLEAGDLIPDAGGHVVAVETIVSARRLRTRVRTEAA